MKFTIISALIMSAVVLGAQLPQKSVIVTYPDETPDDILIKAKDAIKTAGGMITHEYNLFKGFAAKAPAKALESVQALSTQFIAVIEDDQMVSIVGTDE